MEEGVTVLGRCVARVVLLQMKLLYKLVSAGSWGKFQGIPVLAGIRSIWTSPVFCKTIFMIRTSCVL